MIDESGDGMMKDRAEMQALREDSKGCLGSCSVDNILRLLQHKEYIGHSVIGCGWKGVL